MSSGPYYHGGTRTLGRGRLLLPPSRTGAPSSADFGAGAVCRRDRVYITTDLDQARMFAIMAPPKGNGSVYEVEPIGALEADPDYSGSAECFQVPEARVLLIVEKRVEQVFGCGIAEIAAIVTADGDSFPTANRLRGEAA